jgi:hypothetical protein
LPTDANTADERTVKIDELASIKFSHTASSIVMVIQSGVELCGELPASVLIKTATFNVNR